MPATDPGVDTTRITGKMVKGMRKKLGITQKQSAKLLDVSYQSIAVWEKKKGPITFRRPETKADILDIVKAKKTEIRETLGSSTAQPRAGMKRAEGKQQRHYTVQAAMIKQFRKIMGLSQDDFAKLAGVTNQMVSVWERKKGILNFRGNTGERVSAVLNMGADTVKKRLAAEKKKH